MYLGGKGEYGDRMLVTHKAQEPEEDPFALWTGLAGHDAMYVQLWYTWLHKLAVLLGYWDCHFAKHHLLFFFSISLPKIWEEQTRPEESKQQKGFGC